MIRECEDVLNLGLKISRTQYSLNILVLTVNQCFGAQLIALTTLIISAYSFVIYFSLLRSLGKLYEHLEEAVRQVFPKSRVNKHLLFTRWSRALLVQTLFLRVSITLNQVFLLHASYFLRPNTLVLHENSLILRSIKLRCAFDGVEMGLFISNFCQLIGRLIT